MPTRDLGIHLSEQQKKTPQKSPMWMDWTVYNIYINGQNQYLSVGSVTIESDVYEFILEFNDQIFDKMLSMMPSFLAAAIKENVQTIFREKSYPRQLVFEDDVAEMRPHFFAEVKLGEKKKLGDTKYIPLIVTDVSP